MNDVETYNPDHSNKFFRERRQSMTDARGPGVARPYSVEETLKVGSGRTFHQLSSNQPSREVSENDTHLLMLGMCISDHRYTGNMDSQSMFATLEFISPLRF
ncbi:hypothetical protein Mapa_013455 [Marchantia paleacea]|nr:hypothetical protein Mapa_013455 [Marchantia paleacea]